ncbi:MAG: Lrp/AsnC family transcriptional regulator [Alphaproteobacteria bacterium]|nr:Lrp/AsnC family transcriptional regulator [Alphaproteobacteria bacterium]
MIEKNISFDEWEIKILLILQEDASLSIAELAQRVGLSQTPCWRRVKRLKEIGVIRRTAAILDRHALGLEFVSYTYVKLALPSRDNMEAFETAILRWPEVTFCEKVTGAVDYLIKVVCVNIQDYDLFLRDKLLALSLVADTQSRIVVSTIKDETSLPIRGDGTP